MADRKKTVLVTGASGGVGGALAKRLAGEGWRVFATARDAQNVPRVSGVPGEIVPIALELCDDESIAGAGGELRAHLGGGGLDGLVNNAGVIVQGPLEWVPPRELKRQFDVNVLGQIGVTQAVLPLLRAARGRVVNVGAPTGEVAIPLLGPIGASKAALHSLNDALRMELKHQGVAVSLIIPGQLETEIFAKAAVAAEATGPASDEAARVYAAVIERAARKTAEMKGSPVQKTVAAIQSALTDRRPRARYVAGADARQVGILRLMPRGLRERVLMSTMGVDRQAFEEPRGKPAPV
jgi:NAD(P)-dependent dehydrogenase (short-subunit alcohol dehydrogenase family)